MEASKIKDIVDELFAAALQNLSDPTFRTKIQDVVSTFLEEYPGVLADMAWLEDLQTLAEYYRSERGQRSTEITKQYVLATVPAWRNDEAALHDELVAVCAMLEARL
ncbi:MAG: hypothetical protein CTY28_12435 [Hyphomicrobium sp.]|nr:MAG: hypothetical protein CTY28_12435 [Hyphomicrobium sp.]